MCTLTIFPTESGYLAAMNRDELKSRPLAEPRLFGSGWELLSISPRENSGGAWIAANEHGNMLALLNWNLPSNEVRTCALSSRGTIIPRLIEASNTKETLARIRNLPFGAFAPFRLVGLFRDEKRITESRWNGRTFTQHSFPWKRGHWFSSSLSDEQAARERSSTCEMAARQWPTGQSWLRRLHRSHTPHAGAFSVCMHRQDATTVSYTEVRAEAESITMSYLAGSPCQKEDFDAEISLAFRRPAALAAAV